MNGTEQMNRWRLILGKQAKDQISFGDGGWLEGGICVKLQFVFQDLEV